MLSKEDQIKLIRADFQKKLQNTEGIPRIKLLMQYRLFLMGSNLMTDGSVLFYEYIAPVTADGKLDIKKGKERMKEVAEYFHEEIEKPFIKYVADHPNHSDDWYRSHFMQDTTAGKYYELFSGSLLDAASIEAYKSHFEQDENTYYHLPREETAFIANTAPMHFPIVRMYEAVTDQYSACFAPEERFQTEMVKQMIVLIKEEVYMRDRRSREVYKTRQKMLKSQEDPVEPVSVRAESWRKFAGGLDFSFLSNPEIKKNYNSWVSSDLKTFLNPLNPSEAYDIKDDPKEQQEAEQEALKNAARPKAPVINAERFNPDGSAFFSDKKKEDILSEFEALKAIQVEDFKGYHHEIAGAKSADLKRIDRFVENLLDLKFATDYSTRRQSTQKLYDDVIAELKKEPNATSLHKYLRNRTLASLTAANGKIEDAQPDDGLNPAFRNALEYYNFLNEITGDELRRQNHKNAREQAKNRTEDAQKILECGKMQSNPLKNTINALFRLQAESKMPQKNGIQKLCNSSLLYPFSEAVKQELKATERTAEQRNKGIKHLEAQTQPHETKIAWMHEILVKSGRYFDKHISNIHQTMRLSVIKKEGINRVYLENGTDKFISMINAIESLRTSTRNSFTDGMENSSLDLLKTVSTAMKDYLDYAEQKPWYLMIPGSTGKTRYNEVRDAKEFLDAIIRDRPTLDDEKSKLSAIQDAIANQRNIQADEYEQKKDPFSRMKSQLESYRASKLPFSILSDTFAKLESFGTVTLSPVAYHEQLSAVFAGMAISELILKERESANSGTPGPIETYFEKEWDQDKAVELGKQILSDMDIKCDESLTAETCEFAAMTFDPQVAMQGIITEISPKILASSVVNSMIQVECLTNKAEGPGKYERILADKPEFANALLKGIKESKEMKEMIGRYANKDGVLSADNLITMLEKKEPQKTALNMLKEMAKPVEENKPNPAKMNEKNLGVANHLALS